MATEIHILPKPKIMDTDESFRWPEKGHVEAPDWDAKEP